MAMKKSPPVNHSALEVLAKFRENHAKGHVPKRRQSSVIPPEETEEYWIDKGEPEFQIPTWKPGDPLPESRPWRPLEYDESKVTHSGQRYLEIRDRLTGRYKHERALAQARREWSELLEQLERY